MRPGVCFSKVPKTFGAQKTVRKSRTRSFCKGGLSYVANGIQIKITAKFQASRRLRFEDTKRTMSPEMLPKSFGTFEKRAPDGTRKNTRAARAARFSEQFLVVLCKTTT